jgi:hypothetical protein
MLSRQHAVIQKISNMTLRWVHVWCFNIHTFVIRCFVCGCWCSLGEGGTKSSGCA